VLLEGRVCSQAPGSTESLMMQQRLLLRKLCWLSRRALRGRSAPRKGPCRRCRALTSAHGPRPPLLTACTCECCRFACMLPVNLTSACILCRLEQRRDPVTGALLSNGSGPGEGPWQVSCSCTAPQHCHAVVQPEYVAA
jgi:hypothetical protein